MKCRLSVFLNTFLITGSLTICSLLFDDELLTRVGIYLSHLWQLLLNLGLLLFVFLEAFFTLIWSQLRMWCALWQAVITWIFWTNRVAFWWILCLCCGSRLSHINLPINRVFVLTLASWNLLIIVHSLGACAGHYIRVTSIVWIVFLSIVSSKLVLILQERVLVTMRASRSVRHIWTNVISSCSLGLTWWIYLEKLLSTLIHMRSAWILAWKVVSMCHWICKRILGSNWALALLVLWLHWFYTHNQSLLAVLTLIWQAKLLHTCHVHLERTLICE